MKIVFNTEGDNEALGPYVDTVEDAVVYSKGDSIGYASVPADCVTVREITRDEVLEVFAWFKRSIDSSGYWVDGDSLVALNGLVQAAVQMIEYAQVHGAALTVDQAYANLRREVGKEKRYIGARQHSRAFEETTV